MISYDDALKLLQKYVTKPDVVLHSKGVSDVAYKLAKKINEKHPETGLDVEKVRIAALLHDIGKESEERHEERSLKILKKEGLDEVSKTSKHGFLYLKQVEEERSGSSTEDIENKIVVYSDMRFKFSLMTIDERLKEASTGWTGTDEEIQAKIDRVTRVLYPIEKELFELSEEEF